LQECKDFTGIENLIEKYKFEYAIYDFSTVENKEGLENIETVILPIEAAFYGLNEIKKSLAIFKNYPKLAVKILISKYDENGIRSAKVKKYIQDKFSSLVYNSIISRNYYLGLEILTVENLNKTIPHFGFADYLKLANEIKEQEING
jgi:hypothetical protein